MKFVFLPLVIMLAIVVASAPAMSMQSNSYQMESPAISSAGGIGSSLTYNSTHNLGHSTGTGRVTSSTYDLLTGFWYQFHFLIYQGDLDGDEDVDLNDIIIGLRVLSGQVVDGVKARGDVNNDDAIGLEEVVFGLMKVSQSR